MTATTTRELVGEAILATAPDADLSAVAGDESLRRALDIDSLDFLVLVEHIQRLTGVDVPERDYGAVSTLDDLVHYVEAHSAGQPGREPAAS